MRMLVLVAMVALPLGCAHRHEARNVAQRQPGTTPRGDFDSGRHDDRSRHRPTAPVEPPIVTPPIP